MHNECTAIQQEIKYYVLCLTHTPNMYCICIRGRLNVSFELFSHSPSHLATLLLGER
jgi:hypothetical protein